jgi:hypothetical protein
MSPMLASSISTKVSSTVYGKSYSIGAKADEGTNALLREQAEGFNVYDLESSGRWFAINRDTEHELVGTGLDAMRKFKIL